LDKRIIFWVDFWIDRNQKKRLQIAANQRITTSFAVRGGFEQNQAMISYNPLAITI
jgi:hypothetical protein